MNKPDDIPQDVWDEAIAIETGYEGGELGRRPLFISRAIMAAKAEEREACIRKAWDHVGQSGVDQWARGYRSAAASIAESLKASTKP